jgi:hypothetical protein
MRRTGGLTAHPFGDDAPPVDLAFDPWASMPSQYYDWTCSACSTEWVERAIGFERSSDIYANRQAVVEAIGYTNNINPTYGLMDGSGAQLQRVLKVQTGRDSGQARGLDFDAVYAIASSTPGLMSGQAWYHWVALRGVQGANLWIANSAPGYKGIYDTLTRQDYARLGGFSVVWLT